MKGFESLADRRRPHYLHVRSNEVELLGALGTKELRLHRVFQDLERAISNAEVVERTLSTRGLPLPSFEHLFRLKAVLARVTGIPGMA